MKKAYQYNGKTYTTITAIAKEVGKSRLYQKDFDKYGITVLDTPTTYTTTAQVATTTTSQTVLAHLSTDGIVADKVIDIPQTVPTYTTATTYTTVPTVEEDDVTKLEREVVDMTRYTFGKALSKLSMESLIQMAKNIGVTQLWENISNAPIRRMRVVMEVKEAYFPTNAPKGKPATPWKGIPFDKLVKVAEDKGITWIRDKHPNIDRMRLIMALKKNDIQATDI